MRDYYRKNKDKRKESQKEYEERKKQLEKLAKAEIMDKYFSKNRGSERFIGYEEDSFTE